MNRHAVALAADSATTVTRWVKGEQETRYFKGANKIFQLANGAPVGLMIYGSGTLHRVPWELIVKEYRRALARGTHPTLEGYARGLVEFITSHNRLFPEVYQEELFSDLVGDIAARHVLMARRAKEIDSLDTDEKKRAAFAEYYNEIEATIDRTKLSDLIPAADLERALAKFVQPFHELAAQVSNHFEYAAHIDVNQLARISIKAAFKFFGTFMEHTGVVIAGYGEDDFFPSYIEYKFYGLLLNRFLFAEESRRGIDLKASSHIKAFAQSNMVDTFRMGFSPDVFGSVQTETKKSLLALANDIRSRLGGEEIADLDDIASKHLKDHTEAWTDSARDNHTWPLYNVVDSLPLDEMAGLAETLVMLESLKEKVTRPTESVSGPIDVAVITKGDGFIWTKRKHYFDPKINPRFLARQGG